MSGQHLRYFVRPNVQRPDRDRSVGSNSDRPTSTYSFGQPTVIIGQPTVIMGPPAMFVVGQSTVTMGPPEMVTPSVNLVFVPGIGVVGVSHGMAGVVPCNNYMF